MKLPKFNWTEMNLIKLHVSALADSYSIHSLHLSRPLFHLTNSPGTSETKISKQFIETTSVKAIGWWNLLLRCWLAANPSCSVDTLCCVRGKLVVTDLTNIRLVHMFCCALLCCGCFAIAHWRENVVILTKFSLLAALEVVILTVSSAASDENFIKMKAFPFQCCCPTVTEELLRNAGKISQYLNCKHNEVCIMCTIWAMYWILTHWDRVTQICISKFGHHQIMAC